MKVSYIVHKKGLLARLALGTPVAVGAAAAALLTGGVANAAALPRSVDFTTVQTAYPATTTTTLAVTPPSPTAATPLTRGPRA